VWVDLAHRSISVVTGDQAVKRLLGANGQDSVL